MTVTVGLDADRSSPGIVFASAAGTQPTLRGISALFDANNVNNLSVTWPTGTQVGDLVLIFSHQGYNSNAPTGWSTLDRTTYNGNHGGAVFYKIMDSADITAGGVNYTFGGTWWGGAVLVAYEDGINLSIGIFARGASTGAPSGNIMPCAYPSENERSYLLFGSGRDGDVTFNVATPDVTQSATSRYLAFAELSPATDSGISEQINWVSAANGYYGILVTITKNAPGGSGLNLLALSSAISMASEQVRSAVGALYFEAKIIIKAGTPSVGLIDYYFNPGAQTLGTTIDSIAYQSDGLVRCNNATLATISAFAAGDIVCVAFHPGLKLIWFKVNGGSWNNDGSANPATFVNGIDTSTFRADRVTPAIGFSTGGGITQVYFADAEFNYSEPSGYSSIEETVVTTAWRGEDPAYAYADPASFPTDIGEPNVIGDLGTDNFSRTVAFPAGPVKTIAGEVQEEGVGVEGRLVRLYNRSTGELVGEFRSNALGEFLIPAADPAARHFVVAFDDDITPDYNAKIYDNVIPQ